MSTTDWEEKHVRFCDLVDRWYDIHYADGEGIDPKARIMKDKIRNLKIQKMISLRLEDARRTRQ
jgi:hypothetical protein